MGRNRQKRYTQTDRQNLLIIYTCSKFCCQLRKKGWQRSKFFLPRSFTGVSCFLRWSIFSRLTAREAVCCRFAHAIAFWRTERLSLVFFGSGEWKAFKRLKMFLALMSSISNLSFMNSSRRLLSFSLSMLISFLSFFQLVKSFISSSATASMLRPLVQMVTPGKVRLVTGLAASFKLVVTKFSCQLL